MGKKAQFFILGSVIILLVLYNIITALNSNWQTDVSEVQGNDAAIVFKNLENGLNRTINSSDGSNIEKNLDSYLNAQKIAVGESYNIDTQLNITATNVIANITLSSSRFYAEKEIVFMR